MKTWVTLAKAAMASGDEIILRQRGDIFEIRFNGIELMSSFNHQSEDLLALRAMREMDHRPQRILIGGLGLGYTLRAVLELSHDTTEVHVCEISPEIVEWNRSYLGHLAGNPLNDPRCHLHVEDVQKHLAENPDGYDMILLDTDNGPDFVVRPENDAIYHSSGIGSVMTALRGDGIACFWSATVSDEFERRLRETSPNWRRDDITLVPGRVDAMHHIYVLKARAAHGILDKAA